LENPEKFAKFLRVLWDELFWANFYYDIFKEASRLCKEHEQAVKFSPYFWHFTLQAHCQTALVHLHRIYDQNKDSFNLHRFLLTVRDNKSMFHPEEVRKRRKTDPHAEDLIQSIGGLDAAQLEIDIKYSSRANPKVENLKTWRDRVTFHKDERELFREKPFEQEYPLTFGDIDELLSEALKMLNRYSQYFDTSIYSLGFREWKDMVFVFEALEHHPVFIRRQTELTELRKLGLA
jgi:hypothetical protein